MTVRPTESRKPPGVAWEDLGPTDQDGNFALVSYLTSPIVIGSVANYVIFGLNNAEADRYLWHVSSASGEVASGQADIGIFEFIPDRLGEITVIVQVEYGGNVVASLTLNQSVIPENALFADLIESIDRTGSLGQHILAGIGGDPPTTWELVNDLRNYVFRSANLTGGGIPAQLLAAVVYKEALWRPKTGSLPMRVASRLADFVGSSDIPVRGMELSGAIRELNAGQLEDFRENSLGVCQIKMATAAMILGLTPQLELPSENDDRPPVAAEIQLNFDDLAHEIKIDIFNLLRFPQSNIWLCGRLLAYLKSRPNRYPGFSAAQMMQDLKALQILATEYNMGAIASPSAGAKPNRYGRQVGSWAQWGILTRYFTTQIPADLLRLEIVSRTYRELSRWRPPNQPVIHESDPEGQEIIRNDYWSNVGVSDPATFFGDPAWYSNIAWSAIFVSFCANSAARQFGVPFILGDMNLQPFSRQLLGFNNHYCYSRIARRDRNANQILRYWAFEVDQAQIEIGDIVVKWRNAATNWSQVSPSPCQDTGDARSSHGDIVVAVRGQNADVVGGNVVNTVTQNTYPLTAIERIDDSSATNEANRVFVVLKPIVQ